MAEGGPSGAIWQFIKTLFWLTPTSLDESHELRDRIEEEKRNEGPHEKT